MTRLGANPQAIFMPRCLEAGDLKKLAADYPHGACVSVGLAAEDGVPPSL